MGRVIKEMKPIKEQKAFHNYYTREHPLSTEEEIINRREPLKSGNFRARVVVKTPQPVPPSTWTMRADRQEQVRRRRGHTYTALVPRTLAQTGMPASSGRMRAMRLAQQQHNGGSPIPVRSGRRGRRAGFFARVLALLVVLAIGVVGVNFALSNPAFRVQEVSVVGTKNQTLISSIEHMGIQGQNIFLVDTAALAARIEMLPLVASASLEKQWPDQLTVTVAERVGVLLWQTKQGTYGVDRQGMAIAAASETAGADQLMTVVDMRDRQVGVSGQPIGPGVRLNQADVAFALQVFAQLPRVTGINDFILRYDAADVAATEGSGSYVVEGPGGWVAYLGDANDTNPLDNRLVELQHILALAQKQQLQLAAIDLRFGLRPVYTLKS
jgi:hypothetical protein